MKRAGWPLLLVLASVPAAGATERLWTNEAPEPCRIAVEHPIGDLELRRVRGTPQVLGEHGQWVVATTSEDGVLRLRTTPADGTSGHVDGTPVRVEIPRNCELAVIGGAGRVELHGRHRASLTVETVTGEIVLWTEERADLRVTLRTSGEMGVDYSIDIEHLRHQEPDKRGEVVLGDGTIQVHLASKRGAVRVLDRGRAAGH